MTYKEKIENGEDVNARILATYGPETEKGYPVELEINVSLKFIDGKGYGLSVCGSIEMKACSKLAVKPYISCGQCLDTAVRVLDESGLRCRTLEKLIPIWRTWHLNDMMADSPRQRKFLEGYQEKNPKWNYSYDDACRILKARGLYDDEQYLVGDKPYRYGTAWLFEKIPHDVLLELCGILDETMTIQKKETK